MELVLDINRRYTYADYLTWWDDIRRELIDGVIKLFSPAATLSHADVVANINYALSSYIRRYDGPCRVYTAPIDVRLPKNGEKDDEKIYSVVQPDVVVICDPSKLDEKGCLGAPDMVIEVLSPSTRKYDLHEKFNLYESSGVKEYWTISPKDKDVNVFLLQDNGKYDGGTVYQGRVEIPVQSLPGLEISTHELFSNIK